MNVGITTSPITNMNLGTGFSVNVPGAWTPWTPVIAAGLTIGNGTITGGWTQVGKTVFGSGYITFGSTTAVTARIDINLPVVGAAPLGQGIGQTFFLDHGVRYYSGFLQVQGALYFYNPDMSPTSATSPFTWAINDTIIFNFMYECA